MVSLWSGCDVASSQARKQTSLAVARAQARLVHCIQIGHLHGIQSLPGLQEPASPTFVVTVAPM